MTDDVRGGGGDYRGGGGESTIYQRLNHLAEQNRILRETLQGLNLLSNTHFLALKQLSAIASNHAAQLDLLLETVAQIQANPAFRLGELVGKGWRTISGRHRVHSVKKPQEEK